MLPQMQQPQPGFKLPQVHMRKAFRDPGTVAALMAEFLGMVFFQLFSGTIGDSPLVAGLTFAAIMYATKYVSGGHLNPAVSFAAAGSGHIDWSRAILYACAQALGAIVGAMLQVGLAPDLRFGHHSPACFHPDKVLKTDELFGWEVLSTFFFVLVMYSSILTKPGHGDAAPLAAGFALFSIASTAGDYTDNSVVNASRVFAGSLVFNCDWAAMWVMLVAQLVGCIAASFVGVAVYGRGPHLTGHADTGRPTDTLRESLMSETGGVPGV